MLRVHKRYLFIACMLLVGFNPLMAADRTFTATGGQKNQLIELYTSEGCSSCPPADRWISKLKADGGLFERIFPVAFHVDYWDALGWKDRFADQAYSNRQRTYQQQSHISQVYTPGFVIGGKEWRGFFNNQSRPAYESGESGLLSATIEEKRLSLQFQPYESTDSQLEANIALLGFDLTTRIKTGENSGKTLQHDFVVVGFKTEKLESAEDTGYRLNTILPNIKPSNITAKAVVIWTSNVNDQRPLQVTGGWL